MLSLEANRQMMADVYHVILHNKFSKKHASVEDVFVGHICLLCGSSGKVYYFCAVILRF